MSELKHHSCIPCSEGLAPLAASEFSKLLENIPGWEVVNVDAINRLQRTFTFADFRKALEFTNQVGELAEAEQHHPEIVTEWGRVRVSWWTHAVKGLHLNDFIMADKTSALKTA